MSIHIERYEGAEIKHIIEQVARVSSEVFMEYPYLFSGDVQFEIDYLRTYTQEPQSTMFVVFDAASIVGFTVCIPLESEEPDFYQPLEEAGYDPKRILYFGESALYKAYRGQGLGVKFFEWREARAHEMADRDMAVFCRVIREENHPLKPANYKPLDEFWRKRGYQPMDLYTTYAWQDINEQTQTEKTMAFWSKQLN